MTAVPFVFIHAFLQTKTIEMINGLEMACVKCLNAITERHAPRTGHLSLAQAAQG
jgi:hypothetical protein